MIKGRWCFLKIDKYRLVLHTFNNSCRLCILNTSTDMEEHKSANKSLTRSRLPNFTSKPLKQKELPFALNNTTNYNKGHKNCSEKVTL